MIINQEPSAIERAHQRHQQDIEAIQGDVRTNDLLSRLEDAKGVMAELLDKGIRVAGIVITDTLGLPPFLHVDDCEALSLLSGYHTANFEAKRGHCILDYNGCQLSWTVKIWKAA